ncbi:hypothetical protein ABZZ80_05800 [Streptomyces sp. NPDC006356]
MKRDPLLWAALIAVLVVLASAEYRLAVACGFGQYVAAGVPAALDVYAIAALRARRDVLAVVAVLIGVNAASHLVEVGLLPVDVPLVVAVSAVAPLVLWRVHRLGEVRTEPAETAPEPSTGPAEPAEPITIEREPAEQPLTADAAPIGPVLGPWTPVAELAGGTSPDLLGDHFRGAVKMVNGPEAEPAAEPVPPAVPPPGTGAADIVSEDTANTTFGKRVETVRNWLQAEPELTGTDIGTRLGVSNSYGRRLLRAAREDT